MLNFRELKPGRNYCEMPWNMITGILNANVQRKWSLFMVDPYTLSHYVLHYSWKCASWLWFQKHLIVDDYKLNGACFCLQQTTGFGFNYSFIFQITRRVSPSPYFTPVLTYFHQSAYSKHSNFRFIWSSFSKIIDKAKQGAPAFTEEGHNKYYDYYCGNRGKCDILPTRDN